MASVPHPKLSVREKIAYSLGDSSANFVFQALIYFQTTFFVDVMGISTGAATALFVIGRFWDAILDPTVGVLADRTKTKWGRFRPWVLWSSLPFAICLWLMFSAPSFTSPIAITAYAYFAYLAMMTLYAINNVPYSALNGVITADSDERTSLSQYRFVAVTLTSFVVASFTRPLIAKLGHGNEAHGYSMTFAIYAAFAFVFFLICFAGVRERLEPDPSQEMSLKRDVQDTFSNVPWRVLFFVTFVMFIMLAYRGNALYLFTNHVVNQDALANLLAGWGFVQTPDMGWGKKVLDTVGFLLVPDHSNVSDVGFGVMSMIGNLVTTIGVLFSGVLQRAFGKKAVFGWSMVATGFVTAWLYFIPRDDVHQMVWQTVMWGVCYGPSIPLLWSMIADAADFSEWRYHRRATGLVFAGVVFALKAGLGIGGGAVTWVLGLYGYGEKAGYTPSVQHGIALSASITPGVMLLVAGVLMYFYPIGKARNLEMARELAERRKMKGGQAAI